MGRGFLSGIFWGLVLSVVVLASASLLGSGPGPGSRAPGAVADQAPETPGAQQVPSGEAGEVPSTDAMVATGTSGGVTAPAADDASALAGTNDPAAVPSTGEVADVPAVSTDGTDGAGNVEAGTDDPLKTGTGGQISASSSSDSTIEAPSAPSSPTAEAAPELAASPEVGTTGDVAASEDEPVLPSPQAQAPTAPSADTGITAPAAPSVDGVGEDAPEIAALQPEKDNVPGKIQIGETAVQPEADETSVETTLSDEKANELETGVTTTRLPRIGVTTEEADAAEAPAANELLPAIDAYAVKFENPDAKPLMSIVLLDIAPRPNPEQLAAFPFPVTFAVDPAAPDAADAMALYRSAGFEVAMLVDLPASAAPSDAEVAFQTYLQRMPQTVAIMGAAGSGLQGSRDLASQVVEIVKETGHGLVTYPRGLNTARQIAEREGVPAKLVFRTFDGAGETPAVMRRFLDQAAFRAGQEPGVIMVGQTLPETLAMLVEWGVQGRAEAVALAPLSAALKAQ